ncbi:MAG TPA: Wzz/FepE/Etk N-terminal domain-containing protein [Gaiellaceae bacterium]|nr:Wzz/FepE/Etk N-terminal domain-containing protein [Gaiellaceae bacterium]
MTMPIDTGGEEPIELRRHLDALRRGVPLIASIAVAVAGASYGVSRALPKHYRAQAIIVEQPSAVSGQATDATTVQRLLNTANTLLHTDPVLAAAARSLRGETVASLRASVDSTVDPNANLIYVTARDTSAAHAAAVANAVAATFVRRQTGLQRERLRVSLAGLEAQLARAEAAPGEAAEVRRLRRRISEVGGALATVGTDLGLGSHATPPKSALAPHPLRNGLLGILVGLFVGVLVALAREQLAPRVAGARELSRVLGQPVIASLPRRRRARAALAEAYRTLATVVRFRVAPRPGPRVVLVTSARGDEGKAAVAVGLAHALAADDERTLLVAADLRRRDVDALVGASPSAGLAGALPKLAGAPPHDARRVLESSVQRLEPSLDVLPAGDVGAESPRLPDSSLDRMAAALGETDYAFVVVEAPALLETADAQALAYRFADVVYVARLGALTAADAADVRDVLARIECRPLGIVVVGAHAGVPPLYHLGGRVPALEDV